MSRFKLVLLCALAVMAVGGAASASSASAQRFIRCAKVEQIKPPNQGKTGVFKTSSCKEEGAPKEYAFAFPGPAGKLIFCLEGGTFKDNRCSMGGGTAFGEYESEVANPEVEGTSGQSVLESEVGGSKIKIECEEDSFKGTLEAEGKSKGKIEFKKGCKVATPSGCGVSEPILAEFSGQLTSTPEDEFTGSGSGEEFAKIKITKCTLKGTYSVKGKQLCKLDNTYATLQEEHELICEKSGSKLKLETEPASFSSTAKIKLVGGGNWAIES